MRWQTHPQTRITDIHKRACEREGEREKGERGEQGRKRESSRAKGKLIMDNKGERREI